ALAQRVLEGRRHGAGEPLVLQLPIQVVGRWRADAQHRLERQLVAAALFAQSLQAREQRRPAFWRGARADIAVAETRRALEGRVRRAADIDRRWYRWCRAQLHAREVVMFSVMLDHAARPQRAQHGDTLVGDLPAPMEIHAVDIE